jgi:O-antigen/teichoic acid export membrane protein
MAEAARRFQRFPRYSVAAALLDACVGNLPLLFVASVYGAATAGFYTMVQCFIWAPVNMLAISFGQVAFGEMACLRRHDPQQLKRVFQKRLGQLFLAGTGLAVALNLLLPWVLPFVLGHRWSGAVTCFQILTPALVLAFTASPLGYLLDVAERQDLHLLRELYRSCVLVCGLLVAAGWFRERAWWGIGVISLAGIIQSLGYCGASWLAVKQAAAAPPRPAALEALKSSV